MNKFFDDSDQLKWSRISNLYGLAPDFNTKEASDKINISDMAYPEKGLYPINTPNNTVMSYCYASEDSAIPADTKARVLATIKNAADFWGVNLPTKQEKREPSGEVYTIKVSSDSGVETHNIHNDTELKEVILYLEKHASDFCYESRRQIAEAILNAPTSFKKQLTNKDITNMQKTAGDMFVVPSDIKVACEIRAQYADSMGHPEVSKILRQLGNTPQTKVTKEMVIKAASIFDFADRSTGMNVLYKDNKLALPEYSMNGASKSEVELFVDKTIGMKNGSAFVKNDITENKDKVLSFFKDFTGEDLSKASDADIFTKIAGLDEIGANAFQEVTGLCI